MIYVANHSCLSDLVPNLSTGVHNDGPSGLRMSSLVVVSAKLGEADLGVLVCAADVV